MTARLGNRTRRRGWRTAVLIGALGALFVFGMPSAFAATTLGNAQSELGLNCYVDGYSLVQETSSGPSYTVPSAGTLTNWSIQEGDFATTAQLEVWHPAGGGLYSLVFQSLPVAVPAAPAPPPPPAPPPAPPVVTTTLAPPVAVNAGDVLGLDITNTPGPCLYRGADSVGAWFGPVPPLNTPVSLFQLSLYDFHGGVDVAANFVPGASLTELSPVHAWIGLKNSDDQGTQFDVRAELLKGGQPTGVTALQRCVTGVTRNPLSATLATLPWNSSNLPVADAGDLSVRLSARVGTNGDDTKCAGPGGSHNSAVGLRFYYDSATRKSNLDATITPNASTDLYFHSDGGVCTSVESAGVASRTLDANVPSAPNAKCKDSGVVNFAGGNNWSTIATWTLP